MHHGHVTEFWIGISSKKNCNQSWQKSPKTFAQQKLWVPVGIKWTRRGILSSSRTSYRCAWLGISWMKRGSTPPKIIYTYVYIYKWKITIFNSRYIFKWCFFSHCHVWFPRCKFLFFSLAKFRVRSGLKICCSATIRLFLSLIFFWEGVERKITVGGCKFGIHESERQETFRNPKFDVAVAIAKVERKRLTFSLNF